MRTTSAWRALGVLGAAAALVATTALPAAASDTFDFVALGARISGAVGDQAQVKLGFRNEGPDALERSGLTPVTLVDVAVPRGTTAVVVPPECGPRDGVSATGPIYRCTPVPAVWPGQTVTFAFTLRIDSLDVARGSVTINVKCDCPGATTDVNAANDTAPIEVNAIAGGGGGGSGLPLTGPTVGLIAGAGGLLLVAGGAGMVIAWRRRSRFVA